MGFKNDLKKKNKEQRQIESQGMGLGFLDFLDGLDTKVKDKKKYSKGEYQKMFKDYDFNDDAKEVMLDMADIMPKGTTDGDDQSGFSGDMEMSEGKEGE
jgi:hypothetical protein